MCVDRTGPFCTFRDASSGPACFGLTVHSTIQVKSSPLSLIFLTPGSLTHYYATPIAFSICSEERYYRSAEDTTSGNLQGLANARCQRLLDFRSFDLDDYDFHERVENGDSTWIVPGTTLLPPECLMTYLHYQGSTERGRQLYCLEHLAHIKNISVIYMKISLSSAGKLLAFSGPAAVSETFYGYQTKIPEDYWSYFKQKKVTAVVRLNRPVSHD